MTPIQRAHADAASFGCYWGQDWAFGRIMRGMYEQLLEDTNGERVAMRTLLDAQNRRLYEAARERDRLLARAGGQS